jgi:ArsR family transcriptional regulator
MVDTHREGSWVIYSLSADPSPELTANMKCLQDCCHENALFSRDLRRMEKALSACVGPLADCCKSRPPGRRARAIA